MCGLFGFVTTKPSQRNINAARALGLAMESRGRRSTGVALLKSEEVEIIKDVTCAEQFFEEHQKLDPTARALIGHTRFPTMGEVTIANAHPYRYGKIVGTHNGMINNHSDHGKFDVDSQAIFFLLDKYSGDFQRAFAELNGTASIVWTNLRNVYLVRHSNPLLLCITEDTYFWASELEPLRIVMEAIGEGHHEIVSLKEDEVLALDPELNFRVMKTAFKAFQSYRYPAVNDKKSKTVREQYGDYNDRDFDWAKWRADNDDKVDELVKGTKKAIESKKADMAAEADKKKLVLTPMTPREMLGLGDDQKASEQEVRDFLLENARELTKSMCCATCKRIIQSDDDFYFDMRDCFLYHAGTCLTVKHVGTRWHLFEGLPALV